MPYGFSHHSLSHTIPRFSHRSITELPSNRRRTYLKLAGNLLVDDLTRLHQQWQQQEAVLQRLAPGAQWALVEEGLSSAMFTWQQQAGHCLRDENTNLEEQELATTATTISINCHNHFAGGQAQWLELALRRTQETLEALDNDGKQPSRIISAWQPIKAQLKTETGATAVDFSKLAPALQKAQIQLSDPVNKPEVAPTTKPSNQ